MKQILPILIILFFAFPASSKWKKIYENETFIEFFEIDAVKKIDEIIYIWSMRDFKRSQKNGNLSTKFYSMYNCEEMKFRILTIIEYPTNMGKGRNFTYTKNTTSILEDSDWVYPIKDSLDHNKFSLICNQP